MNVTACILHLVPGARFACWQNDYNRVVWNELHVGPKPALAELEAVWPVVRAALAKRAVLERRRDEYPPVHEQLEALTEDKAGRPAKLAEILARIAAVKANWPLPVT
ncbi:MAG: hypothetical protein ACT4P2_12575 [Pseudomonadota bacterium]